MLCEGHHGVEREQESIEEQAEDVVDALAEENPRANRTLDVLLLFSLLVLFVIGAWYFDMPGRAVCI